MRYGRFLAVIGVMGVFSGISAGRIIPLNGNYFNQNTNPPTADLWCNGGRVAGATVLAYTEICQDYLGDLLPTSTSGTQSLGTPSLPWLNGYFSGSMNSGTAGTIPVSGSGGVAASQSLVSGLSVLGKSVIGTGSSSLGVSATTIIPLDSSYETVVSSGGAVKLTSTPNISTTTLIGGSTEIPSGTMLVISSTDSVNSVTFQDAGTLSGSQVQLGAATRLVSQYKVLTLIYDATDHFWREIAYANN